MDKAPDHFDSTCLVCTRRYQDSKVNRDELKHWLVLQIDEAYAKHFKSWFVAEDDLRLSGFIRNPKMFQVHQEDTTTICAVGATRNIGNIFLLWSSRSS